MVVAPALVSAPARGALALAAQAAASLDAGDSGGFSRRLADAAALEDPHARLYAHLLLAEQALGLPASAPARQLVLVEAADALVQLLTVQPREPLALNVAATVFATLECWDAAQALYRGAGRLDAGVPNLEANLHEVQRRRGASPRRSPAGRLAALGRRAVSLSHRARPAPGLRVSLCMIVRDEEAMLGRCLASVAGAVDEIVVVDTGSRDATLDIARAHGARVVQRPWTGSFAEARNESLDQATGDWILYLDADEALVAADVERLRELTGRVWCEGFYLLETSYTGLAGDGTGHVNPALRLFRNRPHYRFEGRIHEQIAHHMPGDVPGRLQHTPVRLEHFGYLTHVRRARGKSQRNIELLHEAQGDPGDEAFRHFNLGVEYAGAEQPERAVAHLRRAWALITERGEERRDYVPTLLVRLVTALRTVGDAQGAVEVADAGLATMADFTDLRFAQALALHDLGRDDEAAAAWERCLALGDAPARYGSALGAGSFHAMVALARRYGSQGRAGRARELLERCLREHPGFAGAVGPYAEALLGDGHAVPEVEARIADLVPALSPAARFSLASVLRAHGAHAAAVGHLRAVLAAAPDSSQVRVTLAEALLAAGHCREAARAVADLDADDPFAALGARVGLWATIAAGDLAQVADAQARAQRAGVAAAERAVFAGWAALAAGRQPEFPVPAAGVPLLGVILEDLLARRELETFEALLTLLRGSDLAPREQRELLAGIYLRGGWLAAAASEWMAVCEQAPDARAFIGLSHVARAHGSLDDAATLAGQALVLEPGNRAAAELVARLTAAVGG